MTRTLLVPPVPALGDHELDTGLPAEDRTAYPRWVPAINGKVTAA